MSVERQLLMGAAGTATVVSDPYFKQTTLLLHADGTNGAQNNTFIDSSTNNFTITRNGNTTQGTFTPFSQAAGYWANYFDTSSYFTVANNAAFALPGDFTIELWAYFNSNVNAVFCGNINNSGNGDWAFFYNNSAGIRFLTDNGATTITGTYTVTLNTWTHFAISRSGTSVRIFANGALLSTTTNSSSNSFAGTMYIGRSNDGSLQMQGYYSNLRIVKGSAVYTSAFTPSTTPLTAITNTSLLTCQSNRFVDNGANSFALTPSGTPSVQPFSPFAPTAAYSTAVNGGSGYFDGTGDSLVSASSANLTMGTGDFTLEFWLFPASKPSAGTWWNTVSLGDGAWNGTARLTPLLSSDLSFLRTSANTGQTTDFYFGNAPIRVLQWNHIVLQRSGTTITAYANGKACTAGSIAGSVSLASTVVTAGTGSEVAFSGYIADIRVLKGSAQYSGSTYIVPTAPLTAITNTQLLLSCTNAGIYDNAIKNDLETAGNAQISTAVKKYGTGSLYFNNNTANNLIISGDLNGIVFGTGNFTIECWFNSSSSANWQYILTPANASYTTAGHFSFYIKPTTGYAAFDAAASGMVVGTSNVCDGNWHHIAITNSATTLRLFVDGTQQASVASGSTSYGIAGPYRIGSYLGSNYPVNGYIDDFRITKGIARYTANFTPPTSAFPNQ